MAGLVLVAEGAASEGILEGETEWWGAVEFLLVLMAILGGKGTLWGPVIGATLFHIFKEGFWTFFLGWQYVALGVLIVVIVIYFPEGIMGWLREKYPERFGEVVDEADRKAQVTLK